ncbi:alcohol dehydrogenase catalytic domain-containing protein [Rhodococcoides corynebacterioides]|uniref:alcohol dehydrogenase catalytic domain-containing protein n=1 Tax=Rhodococcoides corynebacterioides TaxID=53972 RepID=UPI001C9ABD2A|nr:alcohol dehydrogenase catalytic domain-containing protein [Rhodococcus corynebacterioides]MBY6362487.1 alcohol dehydrogenase catalytic domain-containing protein [Rhodococcus corynebacterioides]
MSEMQALILAEVGRVALTNKPIPVPGPNDAVVRTTAAMICTSDVHTVGGGIAVPDGRTLGHESVGVVHAIGSEVDNIEVGQRVAVSAITPCFECDACQTGHSSHCQGMLGGYRATGARDGNMAEYFLVNNARGNLTPIPDSVTDEQAVYVTDMLTTGLMGAENCELQLGETVAIIGGGPVGLSATIGARLLGAGRVIVAESVPARQDLARQFGADEIVDYTLGDTVEQILTLTDGVGVDAAVEALGTKATFDTAFRILKPRGRLSNVGYHEGSDPLPIDIAAFGLGHGDQKIRGGLCPGGNERLSRILRLIEGGRIDPTPMTTHRFPFAEVEEAFDVMRYKKDGVIKPLITF